MSQNLEIEKFANFLEILKFLVSWGELILIIHPKLIIFSFFFLKKAFPAFFLFPLRYSTTDSSNPLRTRSPKLYIVSHMQTQVTYIGTLTKFPRVTEVIVHIAFGCIHFFQPSTLTFQTNYCQPTILHNYATHPVSWYLELLTLDAFA